MPLGYAGYLLAPGDPVVSRGGAVTLVGAAFVLFVFTGYVEELVFRGLLQDRLGAAYGRHGVVLATLLFAAVYLGVRPASYAVFVVAAGAAFAVVVERTGSIAGVGVAHGLMNVGVLLVWPTLLG